jgi:hypothetical protein
MWIKSNSGFLPTWLPSHPWTDASDVCALCDALEKQVLGSSSYHFGAISKRSL